MKQIAYHVILRMTKESADQRKGQWKLKICCQQTQSGKTKLNPWQFQGIPKPLGEASLHWNKLRQTN